MAGGRPRKWQVRFLFRPEVVRFMKERNHAGEWEEDKTYPFGSYTSPKWAVKAFNRMRTRRPDLLWQWGRVEADGTFTIFADHNDY